jgi:hypothetical protein
MNATEAIQNIREMALSVIRNFLTSRAIAELDLTEPYVFNAPPQIKDGYDLDRIILDNGTLVFKGSDIVGQKLTLLDREISMENLAEISDWLEDDEIAEYIDEYLASIDPLHDEKDFTFRFTTSSWVDITVSARDAEEAEAKAQEMFDSGDYYRLDEDVENTCELISQ